MKKFGSKFWKTPWGLWINRSNAFDYISLKEYLAYLMSMVSNLARQGVQVVNLIFNTLKSVRTLSTSVTKMANFYSIKLFKCHFYGQIHEYTNYTFLIFSGWQSHFPLYILATSAVNLITVVPVRLVLPSYTLILLGWPNCTGLHNSGEDTTVSINFKIWNTYDYQHNLWYRIWYS